MKIDQLISHLQLIQKEKGNIEVVCGSFCGTNGGHVTFDIDIPNSEEQPICVDDHVNSLGELSLSIELTTSTLERISREKQNIIDDGYDFVPSQFVKTDKLARREGAFPKCPWHNPW